MLRLLRFCFLPLLPCLAAEPEPPEIPVPASSWHARAEGGQWTKARVVLLVPGGGEKEMLRTLRVSAAKGDAKRRQVRLDLTVEYAGNKESAVERYVTREDVPAAPLGDEKDLGQQALTVSGTKLACKVSERTTSGDAPVTVRTWTSEKVPLGGVVRIDHNGKTVFELLDYGPK